MLDYKELLRRAVQALPQNNGASRRAVYEKARDSLVAQLRTFNPPLAARDITTHRLQLEDCIRQVELEFSDAVIPKASGTDDLIAELVRLIGSRPTPSTSSPPKGSAPAAPSNRVKATSPLIVAPVLAQKVRAAVGDKENPKADVGKSAGETSPLGTPANPPTAGKHTWSGSASAWRTEISPTVFRAPKVSMEADYASAMMPFSTEFDPVFRTIRAAAKAASFRMGRADNVWDDQVVIEDVFSMIYRSRVVICDFSGRNPNVFYEAGIAHTLGRDVIPIVQNRDDIPFDIRHHRYLEYKNTRSGLRVLKERLSLRLGTVSEAN